MKRNSTRHKQCVRQAVVQQLERRTLFSAAAIGVNPPAPDAAPAIVVANQAPAFTGATSATFTIGAAASVTIITAGTPTPSLLQLGELPAGVTFVDNGDGTGTLAGTPAAGTAGSYTLFFAARNGVIPAATEAFTLNVIQPPVFTSANSAVFAIGEPAMFTVVSAGTSTAALSESGTLPAGITFNDNGDGTASLFGIPGASSAGTYNLVFTAHSDVAPDATQAFLLIVPPSGVGSGVGRLLNALRLNGTTGNDTVNLSVSAGDVIFVMDGTTHTYPLATTPGMILKVLSGNDSVTIGAGVPPVFVHAGGGNDTIVAVNSTNDSIAGGAGNDSLAAGSGNTDLSGGEGNDTLVAGSGDDLLTGSDGNDLLMGGSGTDLMLGGSGNDTLVAGSGQNTLNGNAGADSLIGSGGTGSILSGNGGADTILGSTGDYPGDTLIGGLGNDSIAPSTHDVVLA